MRRLAGLILFLMPSLAGAQAIVVSPKPDKVAVTVYRDPHGSGAMELSWLGGFALVTETRRVTLPAGEVDLRFEGVAGGLIPQSAVVSGLGDAVSEKNRDSKLLSPGTLIDAYLGQRVHLRRTSKATGKTVEQEAMVRASGNGMVIQTETGIEALRCTGLNETLLTPGVPVDLSAKPTLSVRARSQRPVEAEVTLTYLTTNFDWRAHYVATLAPDGKTLSLFAWLTLANGDDTGFANADTMAVAGRINREYAERMVPETRPINLSCWPNQRTHQTPGAELTAYARALGALPPPPPPAPERGGDENIVVTGSRIMATREDLGDLKLYRVPIPVTVASNSQKQVALLEQPTARLARLVVWDWVIESNADESAPATQLLMFENRQQDGLGLPLPAGSFTLYTMRDGRPFLVGEGRMTDRAVGEKIEVALDSPSSVRVSSRELSREGSVVRFEIVATNDSPDPQRFEARLRPDGEGTVDAANGKVVRRDGQWVWATTIPANGSRTLTFRFRYLRAGN